jgi:hypothetical protein
MGKKYSNELLMTIVGVGLLIVAVVYFISKRRNGSPIANSVAWVADQIEGFGVVPTTALKCPRGFRFFNDASGESFCCNGKVNPYSHQCEAPAPGKMCAFRPNTPDPRGSNLPKLPLCAAMNDRMNEEQQKGFCPQKLPNYVTSGKCCAGSPSNDGEDCSMFDLADASRYCVIDANKAKAGEQKCQNLKLAEMGTCPTSFQRIVYTMGDRERSKYGADASGLTIPVCFGMDRVCIPDAAIQEVQKEGIFNDKTPLANWKYSCSGYDRVFVQRDLTTNMDEKYI